MAQGLKVPFEVVNGRLVKISGDAYIEQLVVTGLLGSESENPFQNLGVGEFMLFAINDSMEEGEIRSKVEAMFTSLESDELAKIDDPDSDVVFRRDGADLWCDITYVNMETQERQEMNVPVPPAGE